MEPGAGDISGKYSQAYAAGAVVALFTLEVTTVRARAVASIDAKRADAPDNLSSFIKGPFKLITTLFPQRSGTS